jgi:hypothetical protein
VWSASLFADGVGGSPFPTGAPSINGGADLVHVTVPPGSYVIAGKAAIQNEDSDNQGEFCELKHGAGGSAPDLDRTDIYVEKADSLGSGPGAYQSSIPLLATATFSDPQTTVTLRCSGKNTLADQAVLVATQVGQLH